MPKNIMVKNINIPHMLPDSIPDLCRLTAEKYPAE